MRKHPARAPRSSSGLGRRPFKAEITSSTLVRGTIFGKAWYAAIYFWRARLFHFVFYLYVGRDHSRPPAPITLPAYVGYERIAMISVEEALARILAEIRPLAKT